jgi:hypothetical protein
MVVPMLQLASVRFLIKLWKDLGWITMVGSHVSPTIGKSQAILTLYKLAEPEASLFDVCSAVCDTPPEAGESTSTRSSLF